jgi:hypothetical protein
MRCFILRQAGDSGEFCVVDPPPALEMPLLEWLPMEPWEAEHRAARRRHSQFYLKV